MIMTLHAGLQGLISRCWKQRSTEERNKTQNNEMKHREAHIQLRLSNSCIENNIFSVDEEATEDMPTQVFEHLKNWLQTNGLDGYIRIAEAQPHQQVKEIVKEINIGKITNKNVRLILNLKNEGYNEMDAVEIEVLDSYFGEYSHSTKAYRT